MAHTSVDERLESEIRDALKGVKVALKPEQIQEIVGRSVSLDQINDEIRAGIRRGEYMIEPGSFPYAYKYVAKPRSSEPKEKFERSTGSAAGITGHLRAVLKDHGPLTMKEVEEHLPQYSHTQVMNNLYVKCRAGEFTTVEGSKPKQFKIAEKGETYTPVRTHENRKEGLLRAAFIYLAESGDQLTADEMTSKLHYKWKTDTVSNVLSSAFFANIFLRVSGSNPYKYYVEYNKRQHWIKNHTLPKRVLEEDPLPEEPAQPKEEQLAQSQPAAPAVPAFQVGNDFNAFMDIHGNVHMTCQGQSIDLDPETSYKLAVLLSPRLNQNKE